MAEVKKDCFGYMVRGGKGTCKALNGLYCKYEECKFYKEKDETCKGCPNKGQTAICVSCANARM